MTDTTVAEPYPQTRARKARTRKDAAVAYESAGPHRLAQEPSQVTPRPTKLGEWTVIRQHLEARLNMMRSWRYSWMEHYQLLEAYLLPRRGIFINAAMPTANTMIRGVPINQNIVDPTGTYAMRRCAAGMMNGLMSPSRPWFKLKPALFPRDQVDAEAASWFEETEDRMYTVMGRSNFYDSGSQAFEDIVTFGTGPKIIYEDEIDLIRVYVPCPGEYYLASSSTMRVGALYRQFVLTVSQIVEMFRLENCPAETQQMWREKGGALEVERVIAHAIEPNFAIDVPGKEDVGKIPGDFTWRESYWIWGSAADYPLSMRGFRDQPHVVPRWAVTSNDPYGRSVGMDVLPDIMQLQLETLRKGEAIEKMVRPPMLASKEMKNEPASILPGKVTYVDQLGPEKGMRPAFTVNPQIKEMMEDLAQIQQRIKEGFFNDLFMMLESIDKTKMTAYEVAQRNQEKLQILGPVIERWQNEDGAPSVKRVFSIMQRKGLLPPLPKSLHGVPLGVEFVGILALAQKAANTASLERFAQTMSMLRKEDPSVDDLWSRDTWTRHYGDDLYLPKDIMNDDAKVQQLRKLRQQQMAQQQAMAAIPQLAKSAKDMSDVDVGGGLSAVQAMTGMGPGSQTSQ